MAATDKFTRDMLEEVFPGKLRLQRAFEAQQQAVNDSASASTAAVEATSALQDATVLTLSANDTLNNERILALGTGLQGSDAGGFYTLSVNGKVVTSANQYTVSLVPQGNSILFLPLTGTLASLAGIETLSNKTLSAPSVSGLGNYANDAAAAGGGVPVGGMYRNGSVLMVRVV